MSWYLAVLKKYAVFSGRARRKEFWMFALFNFLFAIVFGYLDRLLGTEMEGGRVGLLGGIYALVVLLPWLAVSIRRLHDTGKRGWWFLVVLIPVIGGIWLFFLLVTDSQPGANQYGPNPKEDAI